jgi:hypothetical protein
MKELIEVSKGRYITSGNTLKFIIDKLPTIDYTIYLRVNGSQAATMRGYITDPVLALIYTTPDFDGIKVNSIRVYENDAVNDKLEVIFTEAGLAELTCSGVRIINACKHEFKSFDKVLMRDSTDERWFATFFSNLSKEVNYPYLSINRVGYKYCIPYEGNEHLVGKI